MKRLNSSGYFLILLTIAISALFFGFINFFSGFNSSFVLLENGPSPMRHIVDNYGYYQNIKGLVYSATFLVAGVCFLVMILLPSDRVRSALQAQEPPQPVYPTSEESSISAPIQKKEPETEPQQVISLEKEGEEVETENEIDIDLIEEPDEIVEVIDTNVMEGDDDVVYGSKQITNAAIIDFVHRFPDSALKFLYRKQLDGKILTRAEEDIYREWENRGMTRAKVKKYIYTLMEWKTPPKKPLYEIWKILRDHIYDNVDLG